ncbi:MAG: hypothetical protein N3G78_10460 [Desulfobacterota bacterium]|nr:hypothetical protein [Thermodesulfobacteriota bacterium]
MENLVAETVQIKPQFGPAIDRVYQLTKALNNRNVDSAFRKYLKKIATSDDAEGARFVAEMERHIHAIQGTLKSLESTDMDRDEALSRHFPQARKFIGSLLLILTGLVALILFISLIGLK